jgi:intracellular multiplication protein IcmB
VALRNRLYNRMGAGPARNMLAIAYPGGSARTDIKRRVLMRSEKASEGKSASTSAIIEEIAEELFQRAEMLRQKSKAADTSEDMKAAS